MASRKQTEMLDCGTRAPDFTLASLSGGSYSPRSASAGRPVVLAFFKTNCPTCQYAFPFLERMQGATPIFAVSQDDAESTREFHTEFGITLPTLLDSADGGYPASNAYGITHVPSLFLVEPDGLISWASTGFCKSELEELGRRLGIAPFRPGENVPEWKSG